MAEHIEKILGEGEQPPLPELSARSGKFPLSFAQQRLWFLDQLEPGRATYNVPRAFRIDGALRVDVLSRALAAIVDRHESLRTTFVGTDKEPLQVIAESGEVPIAAVDLRELPAAEREAKKLHLLTEEARRPFDLARGPLVRSLLLRFGQEEHILMLTMHHIVSDGWSMGVLYQELAALYAAFSQGQSSPLPKLPLQYADFAQWQRHSLQGQALEQHLSYWKKQLGGISTLQLPGDRPRPAAQSFRGGHRSISLSKELTDQVKALSRRERVTLFMILLAAFKVLLYRYTGQEDIAVGTPIAGRNLLETEQLIGFFINTLVLRTRVSGNSTFHELLTHVREVALEAYTHQDLPFEKLVEELQPERNLSYPPLFQVMFAFQNFPKVPLEMCGLTVSPLDVYSEAAKVDLTLQIKDEPAGLQCLFEYSTDLFDDDTIVRMLGHFEILLKGIVADPARPIGRLPLLTEGERRQLIVEWNDTQRDYPKEKCISGLFEEQARRSPAAVVLVHDDQELTYDQLNRRANQLARYLKRQGVGAEILVAIYAERSWEMILALVAVLKAGGAYVPVDPEYPKERLAFMLDDAQPKVLLTQSKLLSRLPETTNARRAMRLPTVICLDSDWGTIAEESEENLSERIDPGTLAYVIYTSGSTGKPKGVTVEHGQLLNYSTEIIRNLDPGSRCSFAMVQPLTFDSSVTVLFTSLLTGGTLHVISRERAATSHELNEYFHRWPIDFLKITPSHLAALQGSLLPERLMPRRCLIIGGEESRMDWLQSLRAGAPKCAIFNHYGPTETTVGVLMYRTRDGEGVVNRSKTPLGRPIANTQVYILDRNLQPVPVAVPGELHVGGLNLTRGYLNCPDLTAEKFIPNPFTEEPGSRLYKTGDLARYRRDGNIEFLGRKDDQVKIRGYRVEPGEVEAVLRQHADVKAAAIMALENGEGQKQLAAYVVGSRRRAPTVAGAPRYRLPNGSAVAQLNKNETDYMYAEIFERQAYLKHGIAIRAGDCIFDVGANIGLFMLFASQIGNSPKIYSFEPNPAVFEILSANASLYGPDAKLFNFGLSDQPKSATFTFFPGFSLLSGFYADAQAEKEVIRTFMNNQQRAGVAGMGDLLERADDILDQRFSHQTFTAQLRTLSSVIEQEKVERIDLLKINVEKSELDVLRGILEPHWEKIQQIVLEVDLQESLPTILSLLARHGFESVVEQDVMLKNTQLCYVYAIRPSTDRSLVKGQPEGAHIAPLPVLHETFLSSDELRSFLRERLPDYMVPSAFVFLDSLPLNSNGKVDRRALPPPDQTRPDLESGFLAPRTALEEELAKIWAEVLKVEKVGVRDNFFDLGGHSLLATQVISRVRATLKIELPLRNLFESPTIAELAEHIELTHGTEVARVALPILPTVIDGDYPLSFSQERFWFFDQLEPGNLAHKVAYGFRLTGRLNVEALEQSLAEIVRRHEVLRTTVQLRNEKPVQVIADQWSFRMTVLDLSDSTPADLDSEVQRLFEGECRRPFDLSSDLLLRATLLRLGVGEHALFLNSHHVAWDHWCIELFFREISVLYRAFAAGQSSPLPRLPIQYKQYALWQRRIFQGRELERHLAYWRRQLDGAPPSLNLPTDYPRKPLMNRRGGRQSMPLPNDLTEELKILSRKAGISLFMTFLAAFKVLLHRMVSQDDIVVGTPVAGRDRAETEGLIGTFLNSLALRTDLSGNPTFMEHLRRVRDVTLGAYDHQDVPFEKVVEELQPVRDLTQTPIFQVFINMYNFKEADLELDQLSVSRIGMLERAVQFDIEFYIREHDDGLHLTFDYDSDLFNAATIAGMLGHFRILLQGIAANPERRLSDLPMLIESERHRLLVEWNTTDKDYPRNLCLNQLFEQQAERTPDAIAVAFEDRRLTYRELNRRANQLARHLQKLGVGPEVLVGICVERSLEMVVGILGILKAGGAYVPLDPAYPKERLAFILADAQPRALLTQSKLLALLPEMINTPSPPTVICLDTGREVPEGESEGNPVCEATTGNLAYVIYTSGSTGNPKGVQIPQRAVANFLNSVRGQPGLTEQDTLLAVTTLSFDIAILEILLPLVTGARAIILSDEVAADGMLLDKALARFTPTIMQATPATWRMLIEAGWKGSWGMKILCGGEAFPQQLAAQLLPLCSSLWNLYGPTETTIWSTVFSVDNCRGLTPIGRPIGNTRIYLLDAYHQPVPIGIPGELYIGGDGLARGYLNRPDLTTEKFIPNPFSNEPGARLYRTGDLARYLPDGNIEFLGRIDNQVKIRGFRIELGEIESVLSRHAGVREVVVVARDEVGHGGSGMVEGETENPKSKIGNLKSSRRLVAYVVPDGGEALTVDELRGFLKRKLPDYMVPSAFVFLERLPLTPNGKVDRKALPAPDQSRPDLEGAFVAPRTPVEEALARIWEEVLKIERVGIHDDFFDLGGHSLLATQVVSRMRALLKVDLPLRALFEKPTIAELSSFIMAVKEEEHEGFDRLVSAVEALSDEEAARLFARTASKGIQ